VWRRPLRDDGGASVRVLAKTEAGGVGPEEYAVGITTNPESQLFPPADEGSLFTGLSFAEAHWVAAVLASAAGHHDDAEDLLFELRVPVDLTWRDIDLTAEVIEPGGYRSGPLVPWEPGGVGAQSRYAIATYTLDCGHQMVELLRQDLESTPFWVSERSVDHVAARDARSLSRLLLAATSLDDAHALMESANQNLATHPDDDEDDEGDEDLDLDDDR
jgi:hypothetical protein